VQLKNKYDQTAQFPSQTQSPLNIYPRAQPTINNISANATNDFQIDVSGTNLLDVSAVILNWDTSGVVGVINRSTNSLLTTTAPNLFQITSIKITNSSNISSQYPTTPNVITPFFPRAQPTITYVYADASYNAISIEGTNFLGVSQITVSDKNTIVNVSSSNIFYKSNTLLRVLINSPILISIVTVINTNSQQFAASSFTPFYQNSAPIISSVNANSANDFQIDISGLNLSDTTSIVFNYNTTPITGTILSGKTTTSITVSTSYLFQIATIKITNSAGVIGNYTIPSGLTPFFPRGQPTIDISGVFPDFSYNLAIDISGTNLLTISQVKINNNDISTYQGASTAVINNNMLRVIFNSSFRINQLSIANSYAQTANYTFPSPGFLYPSSLPTISSPSSTIDLQISISGTNLLNTTSVIFNYDTNSPVNGEIITQTSTSLLINVTTLFKITSIKVTDTNEKVGNLQSLSFFPKAMPIISNVIVDPSNNLQVIISGNNLLNVSTVKFNNFSPITWNVGTIITQTNTALSVSVASLFKILKVSISNSYLQTTDYTISGGLYPRATPTITSSLSTKNAFGADLPDLQVNISGTNLIDISSVVFNYDTTSSVNGTTITQDSNSVIASVPSLIRITSIQVTNSNEITGQATLTSPIFPRAQPYISRVTADPNNDLQLIISGSNLLSVTNVTCPDSNQTILSSEPNTSILTQTNTTLYVSVRSLFKINQISISNSYSQVTTYTISGGLYPRAQPKIAILGVFANSSLDFRIDISGTNLLNTTSVIFNYDDPTPITINSSINMPTLTNTFLTIDISQYPLFQINKVKILNSYSQSDTYTGLTLFPRSTPSIDSNGVSADSTTNLQLNIAGNNLLDASSVIFNYNPTSVTDTILTGTILTGRTNNLLKVIVPDTVFPATILKITNIYGQTVTLSNLSVYPRIDPIISSVYVDSALDYQIDISGNYLLDVSSVLFNYNATGVTGTIKSKTNNSLFVTIATTQQLFKITSVKITNIYNQQATQDNLVLYPRATMTISSVVASSSNNFQFDISGTNLLDASSVIFNYNSSNPLNSTILTGQTNNLVSVTVPDTVFPATSVQITNVNGQTTSLAGLTVYPRITPLISSVYADSSTYYQINVSGNYLSDISAVTFNSNPITGTVITNSTTKNSLAISIPQQLIQLTSIKITNIYGQIADKTLSFYPNSPKTFTSIYADTSNNFQIDISGTNFLDVSSVIFNSTIPSTSFIVQSNIFLTAVVPATVYPATSVRLINANGVNYDAPFSFTVYPRVVPVISNINADSSRDFLIVINGFFLSNINSVIFNNGTTNSVTGTILPGQTNNVLQISIPNSLIRITSVLIRNDNNQTASLSSNLTPFYPRAQPTIINAAFAANQSSPSSTYLINISGINFINTSAVLFNGSIAPASFTVNSSESITVTINSLFFINSITVKNGYDQTATTTNTSSLIYPVGTATMPASPMTSSQPNSLTITGTNFLNTKQIFFNDPIPADSFIINSNTSITVFLSGLFEIYDVAIVDVYGVTNIYPISPTFFPNIPPTVSSITVSSNNVATINGNNLSNIVSVKINGTNSLTSFTITDNNTITLNIPHNVLISLITVTDGYIQSVSITPAAPFYPVGDPIISDFYYINEINANIIGTNLLNIKNIYYNDSFAPLSFTINSETKITTTITTTGNIPVVIKSVTVIDCFGKLYKFTTVADNSLDNKTFTTLGTKNNNLSYTSVSMIPGNRLGNNISINSKVVKNSNPDVIPASTQVDQAVNAIKYGRGGKTIFGNIGTNTNGDTRLGQIQGQTLSPFLSRNKF